METNKKRKTVLIWCIILFWGVMIALTIRMWYQREHNTPIINYIYSHKDNISQKMNGTGRVCFERIEYIEYISGPSIDQCFVETGEAVRNGDALFQYNRESLDKYVEDKKIELLENNFLLSQIANEEYREILYSRINIIRREVDSLEQLQRQDGCVKADVNGWIIGADEKGVSIGTGAVSVRGEVTGYYEDPNKLIDVPVNVNIGSVVQGKITDCAQAGVNLSCTIKIDGMAQYVPEVTFTLEWAGETYQICLPKEVLHVESGEFFVYIVEEKRGILGNTYVAAKRNITLLNSNDNLIAVEGNLPVTEKIISYSDKELFNGCSVVLEDF